VDSIEAMPVADADATDFEREYRQVQRAAFLLARQLGCPTEEAHDAVQEAALRAWRYRAGRHGPFRPWFLRIVYRAATRPRPRWLPLPALWEGGDRPGPELLSSVDPELVAALSRLPARQRAALWLRYCEDMSTAGVGAVLGASEAAVKQLLLRARGALKKELATDGR
jgi:RNA polymerase sigma-70 factor (ECF subfamily)